MTCQCICHCTNQAGGQTGVPDLCIQCALMDSLGGVGHGMPVPLYRPVDASLSSPGPLETKSAYPGKLEPISDAQKDRAIESAMEGLI